MSTSPAPQEKKQKGAIREKKKVLTAFDVLIFQSSLNYSSREEQTLHALLNLSIAKTVKVLCIHLILSSRLLVKFILQRAASQCYLKCLHLNILS